VRRALPWLLALAALAGVALADRGPAPLTVDYPPAGAIFPPDFAPPTILWHDDSGAVRWRVAFELPGGERVEADAAGVPLPSGEIDERCIAVTNELYKPTPYQASARSWKPSRDLWARVTAASPRRAVTVRIAGFAGDRAISEGTATFEIAAEPVGAPIFYRDVPLMPSSGKDGVIKPLDQKASPLIAWRLRDVSRGDSRLMLTGMPTCANCHSFSDDGRVMGMDVDGPDGDKGAYAIADVRPETVIDQPQVMTWNAFPGRPPDRFTLGFLARVSPDGRHVVATVNEALYVRNFPEHEFLQVFYPTRGIIAWTSRETGEIRALPGADDPAYVHCDPVWTADGKWLVFARARARDPYDRGRPVATHSNDPNETPVQFDLYRIPWNDGRGGTPERIVGASENGSSNSFPKITPDGKFVVFVRSRNGQLLRPDGKLWIVPFAGGEPRLMRCNTTLMNSWHSFSPNGRWMVFSSKVNTPYTQMFLTHLDADGTDSPAILIENSTAANRAVNIPEFVNVAYDGFRKIVVPAVEHHEKFRRGNELERAGKHQEAVAELSAALGETPRGWSISDWQIHDSLSKSLLALGRTDEALEHIRASLALNPANPEMHGNLGYILFERGDLPGAREHLDAAVRLDPDNAQAWHNRATVRRTLGDAEGAIADWTRAVTLDPDYQEAYVGRASAYAERGRLEEARADLDAAVALAPADPAARFFRAQLRAAIGDRAGALEDLEAAARAVPPGSPQAQDIEAMRRQITGRESPR